jgi:cytochrome b561
MIGMVILGFFMEEFEPEATRYYFYGIHKSLGITILILVAVRLFWRFTNPIPHLPAGMPAYQRWVAHLVHFGLYGVMIGMPLSGWLMSNSAGYPVSFWGFGEVPALSAKDKSLNHLTHDMHEIGGWVIVALVGLHVVGAFYHQFVQKDGLLMRMLPCKASCCPHHKKDTDESAA